MPYSEDMPGREARLFVGGMKKVNIEIRVDVEVRMALTEDARRGRASARAARSKASRRRRGQVVLPSELMDRRREPAYRASRVHRGVLQPDGTIVWLS